MNFEKLTQSERKELQRLSRTAVEQKELKEIEQGFDIFGTPIVKNDFIHHEEGSIVERSKILKIWNDNTIEIEILGPGGTGSDTIDINGHFVYKCLFS